MTQDIEAELSTKFLVKTLRLRFGQALNLKFGSDSKAEFDQLVVKALNPWVRYAFDRIPPDHLTM